VPAGVDLPAGLGLAGGKACIARSLLFGSEGSLPFGLLGSLTDEFRRDTLASRKSLSLALGLFRQTGDLPLGDAHFPRLNDCAPRGLSCKDGRIVGSRARLESSECRLPCLGSRLKTIDKLIGFELTHVYSLCAPRLSRGSEKQMKPLPKERLRNSS
jgi:hypothetical protein